MQEEKEKFECKICLEFKPLEKYTSKKAIHGSCDECARSNWKIEIRKPIIRNCLKCNKKFRSRGSGNRICTYCTSVLGNYAETDGW